jgi:hypothetical protein
MFAAPAAACSAVAPERLHPSSGAAVMVRAADASHDGWFWGWFGWPGGYEWTPDYPPPVSNALPLMGFGQYCLNCHASARGNFTFASLANVAGERGAPIAYLSQSFAPVAPVPSHHVTARLPAADPEMRASPRDGYDPAFRATFRAPGLAAPTLGTVHRMPSQTFDNVWVEAGGPSRASLMVTSDQCLGCHAAGSTGLQFDMTAPNPHGDDLENLSPYATWRTSPMGLGGRDPVFFAQLASETQTFHPQISTIVQDACLGCHGVLGQRQFALDHQRPDGTCEPFLRSHVDAVPYPDDGPDASLARYGALARDGLSCVACHRMVPGAGPEDPAAGRPENHCVVAQRQPFFNPDNRGFARTFTGSFLVGPPDEMYGPFADPRTAPMRAALGITPSHLPAIRSSEVCGSCHTVHLPVFRDGQRLGTVYEQTTYPEWAFSDYRTGTTPTGPLPGGAGPKAQTCQACHMRSVEPDGTPTRSKIASIQEATGFPAVAYGRPAAEIDLEARANFARHTLVGLNYFLVAMAEQLPEVLGLRRSDPMLGDKGLDPILLTKEAIVEQAQSQTVAVAIGPVAVAASSLTVPVTLTSHVGHKFPSGVGFRRAFVTLEVLGAGDEVLWASGATDAMGTIVDADGLPVEGERWWRDDCSARLSPDRPLYQPHYEVIARRDQAQVYQELVSAPADVADPRCGPDAVPGGALTTSFLSICHTLKDNRLLPSGTLDLEGRVAIAAALGAGRDLAVEAGAHGVGADPDYAAGGGDAFRYVVDRRELGSPPVAVRATVYYQAIPPFYLQDRFCTGRGADTERLYFLAGNLDLDGTPAEGWKLKLAEARVALAPVPAE